MLALNYFFQNIFQCSNITISDEMIIQKQSTKHCYSAKLMLDAFHHILTTHTHSLMMLIICAPLCFVH